MGHVIYGCMLNTFHALARTIRDEWLQTCSDHCADVGPEEDEAGKDYISASDQQFPVPLYFIGGFGHGSRTSLSLLDHSSTNHIHYLGRAGVQQIRGLNVAFLDGTYNKAAFEAHGSAGAATNCQHYTEVSHPILNELLFLMAFSKIIFTEALCAVNCKLIARLWDNHPHKPLLVDRF